MQNLPDYLHFTTDVQQTIELLLRDWKPDKVAVLIDSNTEKCCLPALTLPQDAVIIKIEAGEQHKTMKTCDHIWSELTNHGFTRHSLLINLGGGVIGDMGGFAAATYKRGIRFIQVPTTLLSMVDASIGGKLGVDFLQYKNHIGIFHLPDAVVVYPPFLKTLPEREIRSGLAEMLKHGLIKDSDYWHQLREIDPNVLISKPELIRHSISIKNNIVVADPYEKNLRKALNYGHTLGHAVETYFLQDDNPLLHGEAIAIGMILENELSVAMGLLPYQVAQDINAYLIRIYGKPRVLPNIEVLVPLLLQDKKNTGDQIRMALIRHIGEVEPDVAVDIHYIEKVMHEWNLSNKH